MAKKQRAKKTATAPAATITDERGERVEVPPASVGGAAAPPLGVEVPPGVNTTPTPTPGIVRIGRGLRDGERGFDRQIVIGDQETERVLVLVADTMQTKEAAELRIQAVRDACTQLHQVAAGLRNAVAALNLGKAAARDLLMEELVSLEAGGVVKVEGE